MTQNDYAQDQADAEELIREFGQVGAVSRSTSTGPAHNPTKGPPQLHPATFAVLDYDSRHVDGTRIRATDKRALLSAADLAVEPTPADRLVEADTSEYKIVVVKPFKPASTVIFYDIQVRR